MFGRHLFTSSKETRGFKIFWAHEKGTSLSSCTKDVMESIFPWKFSVRRHKVRGGMNDNFLEEFNQGRYRECGCLDLCFKKGGENQQPNTSLLTLFFFFNSCFSFLSWFWFLTKFFINDTVLVRAIVSFFAVTLKFLCCDSC